MKPFFTNSTDIPLQDLEPAPELRCLLADGSVLLGGLNLVAFVGIVLGLPLPQEQVLAWLFVAFGSVDLILLRGKLRLVVGGKIALGDGRRTLGLIQQVIVCFIVVIGSMNMVFLLLLVDARLEDLLVLDQVWGSVVE